MIRQLGLNKFAKFSWSVLLFNLGIILWGAFVRATGSGAGCGSHWPNCRGELIPRDPEIETIIEYLHRFSSGLAFVLVLIMVIWALRIYPKGNPVRIGAGLSIFFIITEALVGAALVKFQWVAQDVSIGRVISISIHLINTLFLLAALALTAWWASGGEKPSMNKPKTITIGLSLAILSLVILGVSGAITALGDTLFPANSLAEGLQQDFSPTAHFLLRLRVWHPVIAIFSSLYILFSAYMIVKVHHQVSLRPYAAALAGLILMQLVIGLLNLFLLAPIPMQLIHLLFADLVWISLILFTSRTMAVRT